MNNIERITLYGIKHIIERDSWTPEIRKEMDEDICNKIVDIIDPKGAEEDCCEMDAQELLDDFAKSRDGENK